MDENEGSKASIAASWDGKSEDLLRASMLFDRDEDHLDPCRGDQADHQAETHANWPGMERWLSALAGRGAPEPKCDGEPKQTELRTRAS